jgi:mono/diheme cytochrome c family protein
MFGERRQARPDARRLIRGAVAMFALAASSPGAFADDAARGEIIARRWCAACHVIAPDQALANSDAPTFASIARRREGPKKLKAFLSNPHPKMPDMNLSRSEIADIVAYIGRLDR